MEIDDFNKLFELTCTTFGGQVEEEYGVLMCAFDEGDYDNFKAFSLWLFRNAVKSKKQGEYLVKWSGFDKGNIVEEFYVNNGRGKIEVKIDKPIASMESTSVWVRDILSEEGFSDAVIDRVETNIFKAYDSAEKAVATMDYRNKTSAPPYIFTRGSIQCEAFTNSDYDEEDLVCTGEIEVSSSDAFFPVMGVLERAVESAVDIAEEEWNRSFEDEVKDLAAGIALEPKVS